MMDREYPHLLPVIESRETIRGVEVVHRVNVRLAAALERLGKPKGEVPPRRFRAMLKGGV